VETRLLSFPRFPRRGISTAWGARFFRERQGLALGRVAPHHVWPVEDAHAPTRMLAGGHATTRQRASPGRPLNLPNTIGEPQRVVFPSPPARAARKRCGPSPEPTLTFGSLEV
jgi:hypothetical protein